MGEEKDLNLGLQEVSAKATVWIRCDSSVGAEDVLSGLHKLCW